MTSRDDIAKVREQLLAQVESAKEPASVLRAAELKQLFIAIKDQPADERDREALRPAAHFLLPAALDLLLLPLQARDPCS